MTVEKKIEAYHQLHTSGCFVVPNPWDAGSARALASMGFRALATSSAGLAFTLGHPDTPTSLSLDTVLRNIRDVVNATELPVNADFQAGYGETADGVAQNVAACIATGVAGLSIEDASPDPDHPLYELPVALERLRAARAAIDASGRNVVLTARAECFLVGHPQPLEESLKRLVAYAQAGADCLYAPGLRTPEQIVQVVSAVAPKPVNVLIASGSWMTVQALAQLGVRRISVGSALSRVAWTGFLDAAAEIAHHGTFNSLGCATPFAVLNDLFSVSTRKRAWQKKERNMIDPNSPGS